MDCSSSRHPEFRYRSEFQSHEPEFDYLKSLEIEEKINKIRWYHTSNSAMFLLSTNDKTIKFWKVQEKKIKKVCNFNVEPPKTTINGFINSSNVAMLSRAIPANGITSLRLPKGKISKKIKLLQTIVIFQHIRFQGLEVFMYMALSHPNYLQHHICGSSFCIYNTMRNCLVCRYQVFGILDIKFGFRYSAHLKSYQSILWSKHYKLLS